MLKQFIWNLEYMVVMAFATSVEEAKVLIIRQNQTRETYLKNLYNQVIKDGFDKELYHQYHEEREFDGYMDKDELEKVLKTEPSMVLPVDTKMARIYQHSNE